MTRTRFSIALFAALFGVGSVAIQRAAAYEYEGYYLFLGNYPSGQVSWSHDVQGAAHDDNNWIITNTDFIWKIPVQRDLSTVTQASPGVLRVSITAYPTLAGYAHFGDPVVYRFSGTDYLIVPIEDSNATCTSGLPGAVAIFRCTDLSYVDHVAFPGQCNDAGWVAVKSNGDLVSSRQHVGAPAGSPPASQGGLRFYNFDWASLHATGQGSMSFAQEVIMVNEQGLPLEMVTMQGGEFSPSGELLYLVSGFHDDDNGLEDREGIHVLETTSYQRIAHSTRGFGHFDFYYDPGFPNYGEPEGLTVWDLDDGRAPGIAGQLHVTRLDNDPTFDDIAFKHYTNIIRVNASSTCQSGTPACPFRTVVAGYNFAWPRAEVRIRAGTYPEVMTLNKRIRLSAENGVARIGG